MRNTGSISGDRPQILDANITFSEYLRKFACSYSTEMSTDPRVTNLYSPKQAARQTEEEDRLCMLSSAL